MTNLSRSLLLKIETDNDVGSNTAIVRGALTKGLAERQPSTTGRPTIAVISRLARKHYGTKALQRYVPGVHDPQQPRFVQSPVLTCNLSARNVHLTRCTIRHPGGVDGGERLDVMRWFIKKVRSPSLHRG